MNLGLDLASKFPYRVPCWYHMCRYYLTYRFHSKRLQSRRQFSYGGKCGLRGQSGLELRFFSMLKLTTTIVSDVRCQVSGYNKLNAGSASQLFFSRRCATLVVF